MVAPVFRGMPSVVLSMRIYSQGFGQVSAKPISASVPAGLLFPITRGGGHRDPVQVLRHHIVEALVDEALREGALD